jgi:glycosyltransferase involved in cell wall biosynthesis
MANIKVSVIVPVYNTENHLNKCMDSIINQTLKEIEVICVNDHSTDSSPDILAEYAKNDDRIRVINKNNNNGAAAARNTGMEYATGEYIGFVDSDDWISLEMYEKLYENAKLHDSDIVMSPLNIYNASNHELEYNDPTCTLEYFDENFDDRAFDHLKTKDFFFQISVTPPNKIYKNDFLKTIDARFPEGLIFEDNPFFYYIYLKAERVSIIRDYLYFYRKNRPDSVMTKGSFKFFDLIKIFDIIKDIFVKTNNYDLYKIGLTNYCLSSVFERFDQVEDEYKNEFFNLIKDYLNGLNLSGNDIKNLNPYPKTHYENFMICDSYNDYKVHIIQKEITTLREENNRLKKINKSYKNKLIKIESSKSWKLTKPLRVFMKKFKQ